MKQVIDHVQEFYADDDTLVWIAAKEFDDPAYPLKGDESYYSNPWKTVGSYCIRKYSSGYYAYDDESMHVSRKIGIDRSDMVPGNLKAYKTLEAAKAACQRHAELCKKS